MEDSEYVNLVLEGGGVLGVAYVGALAELEKRGILQKIINHAGASVGAIISGALACGADSKYIERTMKKLRFSDFLDYGNKIKAVYNVLYYKGACPGDYFCEWYGKIICKLTGDSRITLQQVHERYGGRLVVAVVNVSKRRLEYWDYKNRPDMPLVLAVRASMSIQGVFMPVEINGDLYVDGGTLNNYPIKAFHYDTPDGDIINPKTIGLMLMADDEIEPNYPPIETLLQYAAANIECIWSQPQKIHMDEQDWARTIKIPTGNVSSIDFCITQYDIERLIESGSRAVINHFAGARTFRKVYLCERSSHTPDDERRTVSKGVGTVQAVNAKDVNTVQVVNTVSTPKKADDSDWEELKEELLELDIDLHQSLDTTAESVKKKLGKYSSSPPIKIPHQFNLE